MGDGKDDQGKQRWDLLPLGAVADLVRVLTFGATKYGPHSWRHVPNAQDRYYAAALRHLVAWRQGEEFDAESGLPHLAHAMCNLVFLLEFGHAGRQRCSL